MPNWGEILGKIQQTAADNQFRANNAISSVRHDYLKKLHQRTGRNIIAYYSGFLSKQVVGTEINDEDKNGFMMVVHKMDRTKGLDLILHTPGGGLSSTQSIIDYIHKMFDRNVRTIVPQIAMSAGTMIACSSREIWMGKHSNLGPIDPQFSGMPAYGVLQEFQKACKEIKQDPSKTPLWQTIIGQYPPTFLSRCQNAIDLSKEFVEKQLIEVMFHKDSNAKRKARSIVRELSHYTKNKTHDRHIHFDECKQLGLKVKSLEDDKVCTENIEDLGDFQDLVLTVHHCYMHTMMNTPAFKVIENQFGAGICKNLTN
jgi:ATP-dependent protease ClpP protease subunit